MNLAAIDIGTNSVRLLISQRAQGKFKTLIRDMNITRIGENLSKENIISPVAAERTLDTLRQFKGVLEQYKVRKYRAVGTNALRKAENSAWFRDLAREMLGLDIEIISGETEANLSFIGATRGLDIKKGKACILEKQKILVIDIGGGSTEFIIGRPAEPEKILSIETGSVALTEAHGEDTEKMMETLQKKLEQELHDFNTDVPMILMGLAGTITTLAAIDLELEKYDRDKIHHHKLAADNINKIYKRLKKMDLDQRKKVKGLDPGRADIIVAGTIILFYVLNFFRQDYIIVSENDLLDGIIYSFFDF